MKFSNLWSRFQISVCICSAGISLFAFAAPSSPTRIGLGVGLSSSNYSVDGVSVSPAAFSFAAGTDVTFFSDRPFGLQLGMAYNHASPENSKAEQLSVHELIFSIFPTYQFNVSQNRFSVGLGPAYGSHLTKNSEFTSASGLLSDGFHLGLELRAWLDKQNRFYITGKHFIPLYTGAQVRPTLFMAGMIF
jgi:hypothetical protein